MDTHYGLNLLIKAEDKPVMDVMFGLGDGVNILDWHSASFLLWLPWHLSGDAAGVISDARWKTRLLL